MVWQCPPPVPRWRLTQAGPGPPSRGLHACAPHLACGKQLLVQKVTLKTEAIRSCGWSSAGRPRVALQRPGRGLHMVWLAPIAGGMRLSGAGAYAW